MSTRNKNIYEVDDQVFHFYGRQNNRYLQKNYGFLLAKNKYNSVTFKVLLDFGTKSGPKNEDSDTESDNRVQKKIRLTSSKLREDVLAYLRASMIHKQDEKRREHLLLSTPVDPDFELIVIACAIQLLENFVKTRFKTTLAEDRELLK